jgi:hypothetical protein
MTGSPHPKRNFARHYVEMVVVMVGGMVVLGAPAGWLMGAFGTSWSQLSPAMMVLVMAVTMTAPMVAWMRFRGHAWRPTAEMAASMVLPAFAAMALAWTVVTAVGTLMVVEHAAMLAAMLVAMLVRRDEYMGAHHRPAVA